MSLERNDLPALAVKRPVLVAVLNLLIIIGGLAALFGVEVRELPDVDRPVVSVTAQFPGAAPETVDAEVTAILEGAVARVSGVREIDAQSEENGSRVRIEFNPGTDLDSAAADVREAVSRVTRELPDRVEQVRVVKADDNADPIVRLAVLSETLDEESLTARVENDIIPEFLSIDGVASVDVSGERQRLLRVVIDPLRLSRFGLTVGDVADALTQAPFDVPVGSFRSDEQQLIVRAEATAATPDGVKDVIISGTTRVGDVAEAYFAPADATSFVRLDGQPIIGLGIVRQAQSNTMSISDGVGAVVERLNNRFDDLEIRITSDDAVFIQGSVREVLTSLMITVIIVVATIWLFFARFRASLIPSTAIPAALIGALAGIWILGFSINLLTLLALVLATGLIVDDAIVVIENIQRLQKKGLGRRAAAVLGTRQVFFAVVATTAVLVSVFVPISFLPSTAGRLFREFGFVLALAVVISSFVALSIVPALAARLWLHNDGAAPGPLERFGKVVSSLYAGALRWALNHPWISAGLMALSALGAVAAFTALEQELVPQEDRGRVLIFATGPDGVGIDFMERQADYIEAVLQPYRDSGEITSLETIVGRWDPNRIFVTATLADWSERERSQQDIINELRGPLSDIPGVRASVFGRGSLNMRGRSRGGIQVALTGRDYSEIYEAALLMEREIDMNSRVFANPEISYQPTQPQLSIRIDRRRAADLGVPLSELSMTLRVMVGGDELVDLNVGDRSIPIFLESMNDAIADPADLQNLYVRSNDGELIPMSALTTIVEEGVAAELNRTEQRRAIELEADIAPDVALADAVLEMERLADEILPEGIEIIMQGEARTLNETSRDMTITYLFALVIVFLVLAAQFESVTSPVVVMLTVPFGLAAAVYALFLTGVSLNIFSQIGLVMLIGLMAKNGILVVEFADQLRAEGKSVRQAIEEAAIIRLRPITMTLISTILGALPLILSSGAGAEARSSIGWTVFGGLALSGLFTLFLTPVIYLGIARFGKPRSVNLAELEAELARAEADPETGHPAE
ncbi:efflux RND transporter permease subunit [Maricaulis alexandrii]|uniref:efflux RND transporter permease subunit n=1 Tax=Maricaulis alexandrii TaxID=2570354 RepID=UPI0011091785|nr:efflux RND transporter permease subunit [Maricaulis alexandrii]